MEERFKVGTMVLVRTPLTNKKELGKIMEICILGGQTFFLVGDTFFSPHYLQLV